ncbi:MAG: DUF4854 domain-containing protein [Clostridia bacterium]|nr:DUF4854 domain-containing protein [Clostridia bacterium]
MKRKIQSVLLIGLAIICSLSVVGCTQRKNNTSDNAENSQVSQTEEKINADDTETTEKVTETITEKVTETITEKVTETITEKVTEKQDVSSDVSSKSGKMFASMQELFDNEGFKSVIDKANMETDELTYKIYLDGETIVYEYTYKEQIDETMVSTVGTALDSTFTEEYMKVICEIFIDTVKQNVDVDGITVRFVFNNADGTKIMEKEYTEKF